MGIWNLLIVAFALWFGFQWGKYNSRDKEAKEEKVERLLKQADQESDPGKKTKMLLEWYKLKEDLRSRKPYFKNLRWRKQKERRR